MHHRKPLPPLLLLLLLLPLAVSAAQPKNAILLSDVQSLTLRGGGAQTAHRRVSAIPQLRCVSSPAVCRLHEVEIMRCTNQGPGYDSEDVQWSCSAPLPPELKLGSTDVVCEGYAGPDDPHVLKGSCGVEYRLVLTESGEKKFPDVAEGGGGWAWGGGGADGSDRGTGGRSDPSAILFAVIFTLVCLWIIYSACVAGNQDGTRPAAQRRRRNNWGGFGGGGGFDPGFGPGGGGGGDTWDDPPPPYPGSKPSSTQNQGWRPGFWSGLAGGAAAGYVAGGRRSNQQEQRNPGYGWGAGPSGSSSGGGSGSRSTSSARFESTGFGSTSRR
ncbi:hypothetical protein F4804DRAFT_220467 [Jackrogersella minutella]|nr:hypothetical protein F4804DRAFT_220467 [Jackrogersella minutella]